MRTLNRDGIVNHSNTTVEHSRVSDDHPFKIAMLLEKIRGLTEKYDIAVHKENTVTDMLSCVKELATASNIENIERSEEIRTRLHGRMNFGEFDTIAYAKFNRAEPKK
jgi:hypothetical protein